MKALSIKQPWASLIVAGIKPVENRTRKWKHKGPVAIHASKKFDQEGLDWIYHYFHCDILNKLDPFIVGTQSKDLRGGIIGSVEMAYCVASYESPYFFGPYGYIFENPKKCDLIPWKGSHGIFNVPFCPHCFQNYELHGPCPCIENNH